MPRDLEIFFLYQQSGRFPDSQIITQNRFPKLSRQFIQLSFFLSDRAFAHGLVFPAHSDEIVQVFHLFPFYLLSPVLMNFFTAAAAPDASSIVMGDILALQKLLCNRLYKKRGQIF